MEPLKPDDRARILQEIPQAAPVDTEEYQLLLSRRFTVDPDLPAAPGQPSASEDLEAPLAYLVLKLLSQKHYELSR